MALLMPDINLRRRRRRLESYWRRVLHEDSELTPPIAPSSSADCPRIPSSTPMTRHRDSQPTDDVHARDLITAKRDELATDNQDEQAEAPPSPPSKPAPDANSLSSTKMRQPMLTVKSSAPFSTPSSTATTASTSTSGPNSNCQAPTLGTVMDAVAHNETDVQELDFSFLLERGKRLEAEGCVLVALALSTNRTVRKLVIRDHGVGDRGAAAIAAMLCRNSTLEFIDLSGNDITDAGVQELAQALYGHASLSHLQLWSNHITDRGAAALADAVKCNCSLEYLGLVQNDIARPGAQALLDALDVNMTLETLNLATNVGIPEWQIAQIRAVLARNRLEAPRILAASEVAPAPDSVASCSTQTDSLEDSEASSAWSIGGSSSGVLSCSDLTAGSQSGDHGVWI